MNEKTKYKLMKDSSFSPLYYLYISYYSMGRNLGNILVFLLLSTSVIIGLLTKNYIIDTVVYAISFGSYVFNLLVLKTLYNGHKIGRFTEGSSFEYFYSFKKYIGPITILSRFFEIYTPLIIALITPTIFSKICLGLAFIAFNIGTKISNNFMENKKSSIIKKNIGISLLMLSLGIILSVQTIIKIKLYDNLILLFLCFIMGLLKNLLNKSLQHFITNERKAFKDEKKSIDIYYLANIFNVGIRKLGEKTTKEIEEEKAEKRKKQQMNKEEYRKHLQKMEEDATKQYLEKRKRDEEAKQRLEDFEKQKELHRKVMKGKNLTKEEERLSKKLESKLDNVEVNENMRNDRASIRR